SLCRRRPWRYSPGAQGPAGRGRARRCHRHVCGPQRLGPRQRRCHQSAPQAPAPPRSDWGLCRAAPRRPGVSSLSHGRPGHRPRSSRTMNHDARIARPALLAAIACLLTLAGCAGPVGRRKVVVAPQYTGLEGKRVAVLVSVDDLTLAQYPTFRESMTRAVSAGVATSLPGTKVIDPADVEKFQRERPGWVSTPYNKLTSRLDVDRLLVIDVVDFHTREMGNAAVWKGELIAHVNVAERERDD